MGYYLINHTGIDQPSGEKYWLIQNTWGPAWGEEGFFRMKRGDDEFGIESICEVADPIIIDNLNGGKILTRETAPTNGNIFNTDGPITEDHSTIDNQQSIFDIFK